MSIVKWNFFTSHQKRKTMHVKVKKKQTAVTSWIYFWKLKYIYSRQLLSQLQFNLIIYLVHTWLFMCRIQFYGLWLPFLYCRITFTVMDSEYNGSENFLAPFELNERFRVIENDFKVDFVTREWKNILESFGNCNNFLGQVENIFCVEDIIHPLNISLSIF